METKYKFCCMCKHMFLEGGRRPFCTKPGQGINLVWGTEVKNDCVDARSSESLCGREGKWFEPKD